MGVGMGGYGYDPRREQGDEAEKSVWFMHTLLRTITTMCTSAHPYNTQKPAHLVMVKRIPKAGQRRSELGTHDGHTGSIHPGLTQQHPTEVPWVLGDIMRNTTQLLHQVGEDGVDTCVGGCGGGGCARGG